MKILSIITILLAAFVVGAQNEINPGITFQDGQRITAAQLGQLISAATIQPNFYNNKVSQPQIIPTDTLLVYSAASGTFHRVLATGLFTNAYFFTQQPNYASAYDTNQFTFLGYNPTNNGTFQIGASNLFSSLSPWIMVSSLNVSNTLGNYSPAQPNPLYMTNQVQFFVFDTNGVPKQLSISNLLYAVAPYVETNFAWNFNNQQMFSPWTLYPTNGIAPYTNAFGVTTNFAVTNLQMFGNTNVQALSVNDQIPIMSTSQFTNTTVTVGTLLNLVTQSNAIPAYTYARVLWGSPTSYALSPIVVGGASGIFFTSNTVPLTNVAVSFYTRSGGTLPTGNGSPLAVNTQYYISPFASAGGSAPFTNGFRIYTNYANLVGLTNWMTSGTGLLTNWLNIVPTFTLYNADVIQLSSGNAEQAGQYAVNFRTPATTTNYYVSGVVKGTSSFQNGIVTVDSSSPDSTNTVWIDTMRSDAANSYLDFKKVYLLISPQ